jgi:hypothetical protein
VCSYTTYGSLIQTRSLPRMRIVLEHRVRAHGTSTPVAAERTFDRRPRPRPTNWVLTDTTLAVHQDSVGRIPPPDTGQTARTYASDREPPSEFRRSSARDHHIYQPATPVAKPMHCQGKLLPRQGRASLRVEKNCGNLLDRAFAGGASETESATRENR